MAVHIIRAARAASGAARRNSGGRPWCRFCGGVYQCYPDCPTQR